GHGREGGPRGVLAEGGGGVVGPCGALPGPHARPAGESRLNAATAPGSGGRLRSRARFLVQGIDAASAAAAHSAQGEAAADARRLAAGMQIDRAGALTDAETTAHSRVSGNPVILRVFV